MAAAAEGTPQLWMRPLDQATAQPIVGTEGATYPFWSPDSRSVGFFTSTQLKRLDIGGGLPQTICNASNAGRGGSWNEDGVILFGGAAGPLIRVQATPGAVSIPTTLAAGQISHRFPHFLPRGRQFLFYVMGTAPGVYLGSLDSPENKRLTAADTSAEFMPPDWLLFLRQGTLFAQHVDLARGDVTGEPVPVADQVASNPSFGAGAFSVSPAGPITYRTGSGAVTQFTWVDRSGKAVGTVGQPDANSLLCPTLSPDESRVAAYRSVQNNVDIWVFDATRPNRETDVRRRPRESIPSGLLTGPESCSPRKSRER